MRYQNSIATITAALAICAQAPLLFSEADQLPRGIEKVSGDLYRFQHDEHFSLFLVTPDGIIATDPISKEVALWLKGELDRRFGLPVKYLIYSHHHPDHISGGEVFADTAVVVAQERAKIAIIENKVPTAIPQITFNDELTIHLGGKTVELTYVGRNHTDNSIVMRFPDEGVLFAVDFVPIKVLPWRDLRDSYFPDWIESLKRVEAMDFEILAPAHDELGNKADVRAVRHYMEDLHGDVSEALEEGQSLEEMKNTITLEAYKDWRRYDDFRTMNIEGVYRALSQNSRE